MGYTKTKKIIPEKLQHLLDKKVANSEAPGRSKSKKLAHLINEFLNEKKESEGGRYYQYSITVDKYTDFARHLNRTFREGGVKRIRDIICLFATNGECNWDQLISRDYPEYRHLLDDEDKKIALSQTRNQPEEKIVQKQISDEGQINPKNNYSSPYIEEPPSRNDPTRPEFPPAPFYEPKFPATAVKKIHVPNSRLHNVWIKDESTNPTGTHKDRMAWEVTLLAADKDTYIPEISLISSGSAAIAIQNMIQRFKVDTKLKVLVDSRLPKDIEKKLLNAGIELTFVDLSEKALSSKEIKELTGNKKGIDITYRENMDFKSRRYYDWMTYEIFNIQPDLCIIPFGTGDLFINILNVLKDEIENLENNEKHDPRFQGSLQQLRNCNFWGATTDNEDSKMNKLYSYYLPNLDDYRELIRDGIRKGDFGSQTDIKIVNDENIEHAMQIAEEQGVPCEPSGIAGLALLLQEMESISPESKVLIVNTGKTNYEIS